MRISLVWASGIAMLVLACGGGDSGSGGSVSATPESASRIANAPAASIGDEAVSQCRSLAEQQEWALALDPCTRAAKQLPDDLGIRHALQQAQAAAADSARKASLGSEQGG